MEQRGLRTLIDPKDRNKYAKEKFKFDYHPKYKPENDVFIAVSAKTGKPVAEKEQFMPNQFPFGRHLWYELILHLGDRGMLIGEAFKRYQRIVKQLERDVLTEFKYGDSFHNEADTVGIEVVEQKEGFVIYRKWGPMEGRRFWQCPPLEKRKMPLHKFAMAVLKLNYKRYGKLIDEKLLVPK